MLVAVLFASCEETESTLFDPINGQTLATFNSDNSNLPVNIGGDGQITLQVNSTTVSTVDRVVNISVDQMASTADPDNYTVPTSTIIPANEHIGTFVVTGVDVSVEIDVETIVLNLDSIEGGGQITQTAHTISIFEVCPVPPDYMIGEYLLVDNTTTATPNFSATGEIVTLSAPTDASGAVTDPNARTFVATFLPTTGVASATDVVLNLSCNRFFMEVVDINVTCTQDTSFLAGPTSLANASMYDLADDTVLTVNYTEDPEADCGPTLVQNFTLTKQ